MVECVQRGGRTEGSTPRHPSDRAPYGATEAERIVHAERTVDRVVPAVAETGSNGVAVGGLSERIARSSACIGRATGGNQVRSPRIAVRETELP